MANQFDAKFVISTKEAVTSIDAATDAAGRFDNVLKTLDSTIKSTQGGIKSIAASLTAVVGAEKAAADAVTARAKATMAASKEAAVQAAEQRRNAESAAKVAAQETRAGANKALTDQRNLKTTITAEQAAGQERRKNASTKVADDAKMAESQARVATEAERAAAVSARAQAQIQSTTDRTTAAISRQAQAQAAADGRAGTRSSAAITNSNAAATARLGVIEQQQATAASRAATAEIGREQATARAAAATERAARSTLELNDNLSNSRYLLYDVGATYRSLALALLAIPTATTAVATSYEKDFAQVLRTTTGQSSQDVLTLRDDLKVLGEQIPLTFGQLSNIASLGAQLGLTADELAGFTDVTAKFVATTNVGVEDAATAFGRLKSAFADQYAADPAGFFNRIGSAISNLGTASVATDSDIVAVMNQISPLGNIAGFSAQGVAGLSAALASVRVRPEMARGSFQRIIEGITKSADQGSVAMQSYAKYMGITGEQALTLQKTNPQQFFQDFITGIGKSLDAGTSFNDILSDIGAKSVRDKQFILALANNHTLLADSMKLANEAYGAGTYLDTSSEPVFKSLASAVQQLGNSFANLGDSISGGTLQTIADMIRGVSGLVSGFRDMIDKSPAIAALVNVFLGFGAVAGVLLAVKSAQTFALAGMVAFQQVAGKAGISAALTLGGGLRTASVTMLMLKGASLETATALVAQNGATRALGASQLQLAGTSNVTAVAGTRMGAAFRFAGSGLLAMAGGPIGIAIAGIVALGASFYSTQQKAQEFKDSMKSAVDETGKVTEAGVKTMLEGFQTDNNMFAGITQALGGPLAILLGDYTQNLLTSAQAAKMTGVSTTTLAKAAAGSKKDIAALNTQLETYAKMMGAKNADELAGLRSLPTQAGIAGSAVFKLQEKVRLGNEALKENADTSKQAADVTKDLGGTVTKTADQISEETAQIDKLSDSIKGAIKAVFGLSDSEGDVQAAVENLGQTLGKGGTAFDNFSQAGRDNLKSLNDAFASEGSFIGDQIVKGLLSPDEAIAQYGSFVDSIIGNLADKGVDTTQIAGLADQAKAAFDSQIATSPAVALAVTAQLSPDVQAKLVQAKAYIQQMAELGRPVTYDATVQLDPTARDATYYEIARVNEYIRQVTGEPYGFYVDADTQPAKEEAYTATNYVFSLLGMDFTMQVGANTDPAIIALQLLQQFAANVVNSVIDGINGAADAMAGVASMLPGMGNVVANKIPKVNWGAPAAPQKVSNTVKAPVLGSPPPKAAPRTGGNTPVSAMPPGLDGLDDAYKKAGDEAAKAGEKGNQAGKDMADGIDDATKAVNDYAARLKTALTSAYDKQYGLQTATDEYYKALNAINKKREDDVKAIQDAIDKQKELNNERNKDLVDARKAGIEKNISLKYGETDRAVDYANQEQTALDNAAAKQKDIDATGRAQTALEQGLTALDGYSDAAIANREALRGLEAKMLDMVSAYAATGASQAQVDAYTRNLTAQFQTQVGQMGYNAGTVAGLTGTMYRYVDAVRAVPQTVTSTVNANTGGATGAMNAFNATADWAARNRTATITMDFQNGVRAIPGQTIANGQQVYGVYDKYGNEGINKVYNKGGEIQGFSGGGMIPGQAPSNPGVDNLLAEVDGKGLVKVRSREFIMQQPAVDFWGSDFMNSINNMKMPQFNTGGSVGGGSASTKAGTMVVALDAATMAAFQKFMAQDTVLYTNDEIIARAATRGGNVLATKGVS